MCRTQILADTMFPQISSLFLLNAVLYSCSDLFEISSIVGIVGISYQLPINISPNTGADLQGGDLAPAQVSETVSTLSHRDSWFMFCDTNSWCAERVINHVVTCLYGTSYFFKMELSLCIPLAVLFHSVLWASNRKLVSGTLSLCLRPWSNTESESESHSLIRIRGLAMNSVLSLFISCRSAVSISVAWTHTVFHLLSMWRLSRCRFTWNVKSDLYVCWSDSVEDWKPHFILFIIYK